MMNEVVGVSLVEYRLPVWVEWDRLGLPCPHNTNGWVAYHNQLGGMSSGDFLVSAKQS